MTLTDLQQELVDWFVRRIPDEWFGSPPEMHFDRDEILIVGDLDEPVGAGDLTVDRRDAAVRGKIEQFREKTREQRMTIAEEATQLFNRQVSWGVVCGGQRKLFTNLSAPVMTRLRLPERRTLDTLIDAGVARSRSDALAWCVRLVSRNQEEWLDDLRGALAKVERVRAEGPDPDTE